MPDNKALCLNMIVKNEMANLERCLSAVAPYIACWVIGDTGSTDGTQNFIHSFFAARNIPGELHSFPFVNFAQARNEALAHARDSKLRFDYILFTDADMELTVQNPAFSQDLTSAAYKVLQRSRVTYWNIRLLQRNVPASYKGVTHEYLDVRTGNTRTLDGVSFIDYATGSNRVDKYERDIRLLTNAIETERDSGMIARYTFYLANTLRDSGQKEAALDAYIERARLGNWGQEVFMSLLNAAELRQALGQSNDEVISAYMKAADACPTRAEALHAAARFCREKGIYDRGYQFAARGMKIAYPNDALFVRDWVYEYGLLDELAINAYWTKRYEECVNACDQILIEGKLPTKMGERVRKNRQFAIDRLQEISTISPENYENYSKTAPNLEGMNRPVDETVLFYKKAITLYPDDVELILAAARYCRLNGINDLAMNFLEMILWSTENSDAISADEILQEVSICANYSSNPIRYRLGHAACEALFFGRSIAAEIRNLAFSNLFFYAQRAISLFPSCKARKVNFQPPAGYQLLNPSVAQFNERIWLVQRSVNYQINRDGRYVIPGNGSINTRNFLLSLDNHGDVVSAAEILLPIEMPSPMFCKVLGFEDMRLFAWKEDFWISATVREANAPGFCEQYIARIEVVGPGPVRLVDWRVMHPEGTQVHQKNWMPFVSGGEIHFVSLSDPTQIRDNTGKLLIQHIPAVDLRSFRGGSQLINFEGGWLAIVHEVIVRNSARVYLHRFVFFDAQYKIKSFTPQFYFRHKGIEFVAGLAWNISGDEVVVSFGVNDSESWTAAISKAEIKGALRHLSTTPREFLESANPLVLAASSVHRSEILGDWMAGQTNRALANNSSVTFAASVLRSAGLPIHSDRPKAWDSLLAIYYAMQFAAPDSPILDAGAGIESIFLPSLAMLGFNNLVGINPAFEKSQCIGTIKYEFGDITRTDFIAGQFSFAACLSVIGHGVDVKDFLTEMARILSPGAFLFFVFRLLASGDRHFWFGNVRGAG